ncbi:MAG: putative single stranded DNA-binding protein [crAssphage sp. isolate ctbg_1]|uniref:Putative single stranded DNA-binding protein n=1 Tax=crAssphage sp. isolate ctbg_1 TaxID=2989854 RepID=A0A345MT45_9CAUD|nr:MAG: putative single stranded DNA-binding protein [crAssphage sp. isolate ctbg_1]AXH74545.1 MAG: putative single stranded DNA-binding protein [crAssphage sp. isolate ctbg_1]
MAETANNVTAPETTNVPTVKRPRRGVGSARGTTRLKFDHKMALPNGLFLGHIDEVSIKMVTIGEDTSGMPSFNGLSIPRVSVVFASNEADANARKYQTISFMAVESNAETIPGGKDEWKVNQVFDYIKHILNVFILKGRALTEEEEIALSLPFEDFDDDGNYYPVEPEVVIEGWTQVFNNFVTMMNTGKNGNPVFKDNNNKFISCYGKLIRCIKTKKGWKNVTNGDLVFPTFVGEGVLEIYKPNVQPALRVDVIRESITPKVVEAAKKPNMPTMPVAGMGGGVMLGSENTIADPMAGPGGISTEAYEDDPF